MSVIVENKQLSSIEWKSIVSYMTNIIVSFVVFDTYGSIYLSIILQDEKHVTLSFNRTYTGKICCFSSCIILNDCCQWDNHDQCISCNWIDISISIDIKWQNQFHLNNSIVFSIAIRDFHKADKQTNGPSFDHHRTPIRLMCIHDHFIEIRPCLYDGRLRIESIVRSIGNRTESTCHSSIIIGHVGFYMFMYSLALCVIGHRLVFYRSFFFLAAHNHSSIDWRVSLLSFRYES
jgi:hypothetical protein